MDAKKLFDEKMSQLRSRSDQYEKRISEKIKELKQWADPETLWPKLKENSIRIATDKRTLYVAGGLVISFLIIKALLSRRKSRRLLSGGPSMNKSVPFRPGKRGRGQSLLYEIAIMAIQTFLLHYARKILIQFLEGKNKSKPLPAAVSDAPSLDPTNPQ